MDQIKIGRFIAQCRKANAWTQNQLAEKFGITDKAVSKWETGRSMPDVSLLKPLCELFGITLNELLSGEYISEENQKIKSEEVLMEVITAWLGQDKRECVQERNQSEIVLQLNNIKKIYESENTRTIAVNDISFDLTKGSFVAIMGASGSGKTTLLNVIATIDNPTDGTIEINGKNIAKQNEIQLARFRRDHLGFVFQEYNLLDTLTLYENIALALTIKEIPKECIKTIVVELAEKLELSCVLQKFPYEVSGGQRQRCACARAIAIRPSLILADEPTGALDSIAAKQLMETFTLLCKEYSATILMVTHDALTASFCDKIMFMKDGEINAVLVRGQESKQAYFTKILDIMAQNVREDNYVS